jgi:hypothetical protein
MLRKIRPWLVVAALAGIVPHSAQPGCRAADQPEAAAQAPPMIPARAAELPAPTPLPDRPPAFVLPPPPPDKALAEDGWIRSPLLERPGSAPHGWIFNVEASVVWVHVRNLVVGGFAPNFNVGIPASGGMPVTGDIISFPGNAFNATVTPRFELGYRFPDGFGELRLGYRFMDSTGSNTLNLGELGPASQKGRLDVEFIDLDFGTREYALLWKWQMRTAVGMRYATTFYESQVNFRQPKTVQEVPVGTAPFTRLSQTEALGNRYIGAHGVLEVDRELGVPGLTLFGRAECAGLYGRVHQTFTETFVESPGITQTRVTNGVGCPTLATQVGFSYTVPRWNYCRFLIGYQFEMWWQFGRGNNDLSRGTLDDQGLFLRAEFTF